ncbi:MAG: FAD-dependent monooxygenase [Trichocoleus desertorum ATA4-8-CV12]|jgi:3-(3-hydroxy-phenyl)propionate hydroxylase|nr:FAD-dependent monooxygenase [Trichocoleus desertorum ATA4-8-CV12]
MIQTKNQDNMTDVLIVGAGPTGLTLAADLLRLGVQFRILEAKTEPEKFSKACNLWPRTQEVFAAIGVLDRLLAESLPIRKATLYAYGTLMGTISIDNHPSPYGTPVLIGQNQIERILSDYLVQSGQPIERGVKVVNLHQKVDYVEATVERDGTCEIVRCRFLVGCDGNRSKVRDLIGLSIQPEHIQKRFIRQMDARVRWSRPVYPDQIWFFLFNTGYLGVLPLPGGYHRFWIIEDEEGVPERHPTLEEMQAAIQRVTGDAQVELHDPIWLSHGRLHYGIGSALQKDRVFLAGDAGHIPLPISGKGMNTGMQDAFNLGWKLAATLREQVNPIVLDSYSVERHRVRKDLYNTQVTGFRWLTKPSTIQQHVVSQLGSAWINCGIGEYLIRRRLAQLDIAYPNSLLSKDNLGNKVVRAGDRAPDARVVVVPDLHTITLFKLIYNDLNWTLLLFDGAEGKKTLEQLRTIATAFVKEFVTIHVWLVIAAPDVLKDITDSPMLLDFDRFAHKAFDLSKPSLVLIRPDGHVAFCSSVNNYETLHSYARCVFKVQHNSANKVLEGACESLILTE